MELASASMSLSSQARGGGLMSSSLHYHHLRTLPKEIKIEDRGGQRGRRRLQVASSNQANNYATKSINLNGKLPRNLRKLDRSFIEDIASNAIMDVGDDDVNHVCWDDIAGLDHAKKRVTETILWPLLRPDFFIGCRSPARTLLLFGPPGAGKTMIGKAIAKEAKATFFYISRSLFTTYDYWWYPETIVKALFGVAEYYQPSIIFVDEVDSVLSKRCTELSFVEHDRILTSRFLIEMDGFDRGNKQIMIIGATSRPQDLDEAVRSRFTKRLYIPLPSSGTNIFDQLAHLKIEKLIPFVLFVIL